jgi:hypothetical protein
MKQKTTNLHAGTYNNIVYSFPVFFDYLCDTISLDTNIVYWFYYMY